MSHHSGSQHPGHHRFPRARIDPITDPGTALMLLRRMQAIPRRHETLVVLLDDAHRGFSIVTIDNTPRPDQAIDAVECFARPEIVRKNGLSALIIASDRTPDGSPDPTDTDRWFEMCEIAERVGVELVEWFLFCREVSCPRDLVGAPPRWRGPAARSA